MRILFFLLLFIPLTITAQSLIPLSKEGKWGLSKPNSEQEISYNYQFITPIKEYQLFKVGQNFKVGLLDKDGKEILSCKYSRVEIIHANLFVVWDENGASIVDGSAQTISHNYYQHISPILPYLKVTNNGKVGIIDMQGNELIPTAYDEVVYNEENPIFIVKSGTKEGFYSLEGNQQGEIDYKSIQNIAHQQVLVSYENTPLVSFILIDEKGNLKTKKDFNKIEDFKVFQKKFYLNAIKKGFVASKPTSPEWIEVMGNYFLIAPNGKELLEGRDFFYIQYNEKTKLTIARREERDGVLNYYLIDHQKGKILFKQDFKDIVFADFGESNWARISVDTLWDGLIDKQGTIKRTIQADGKEYGIQDLGNFYEGNAYFKTKDNRYGFIDINAKTSIPPTYTLASDFKEGISIVKNDGLYGAINKNGKAIIPITYDGISLAEKGWFRVKKGSGSLGKWGILNTQGKVVLDFKYQEIKLDEKGANVKLNGKWGRYLKTNKWAFPPSINVPKISAFKNGIAMIERGPEYDPIDRKTLIGYKYKGYVKENGKVIIPPIYTEIIGFDEAWNKGEGLAIILKGNLRGFVNYQGDIVLEANFRSTGDFTSVWTLHKGVAKVMDKDGFVSFVDSNGNEVLPYEFNDINSQFSRVWNDSNGVTTAALKGKYGLINYKGERKSTFVYTRLFPFNSSLFVGTNAENNWGLINQEGDTLVDFKYSNALPLSNKFAQFIQDTTVNYQLDNNGIWSKNVIKEQVEASIITPSLQQKSDYIYHYVGDDYAIVSKKGKSKLQGIIDYNHKVIVKLSFKKIKPFANGLAVAQQNGKSAKDRKYGFIDKKGKWVIPPTYNNALSFNDGLAAVELKKKWGYIDSNNTLIIPTKYIAVSAFENNIAVVDHHSLINKEGKVLGHLAKGEFIKKVSAHHIIVKGIGYERHLSLNGVKLYDKEFDEVTEYNDSGIAFVKNGEMWILKRKINDTEITKSFTKVEKEIYLNKYGNHRKVVSLTGDVTQDIVFEKVKDGEWRMIGLDGQPLNNIIFHTVRSHENGKYTFTIKQLGKITNKKGEIITEHFIQSSQKYDQGVIIYTEGNSSFIQ